MRTWALRSGCPVSAATTRPRITAVPAAVACALSHGGIGGGGGCAELSEATKTRPTGNAHVRTIRTSVVLDAGTGQVGRAGTGPSDLRDLSRIQFPARIQMIEVQQRVEDQEIAALGLAAPDRVVREGDDVPLLEWYVDNGRVLRDLGAVFNQARHEQVAVVRVAENHARTRRRRNHVDAVAQLFLGDRNRLPRVGARLARDVDAEAALRHVRIVLRAAARRTITAIVR